jgi:CDP-glycerol glycerophosphotransferase
VQDVSSDDGPQHEQDQPPPLISVIIPVYNVESYLAACLSSITKQVFKDIEIIAVDGASEDASCKILDEMAKREPRLTVIRLDGPGPGKARNTGVTRARGEYIWFVDGDDVISADCLAVIAGHIEAARPDVLFVDYEALHPGGKSEAGHGHSLLGRKTPAHFTLAEQPWATELSMASWDKVIRREFFLSAAAAFSLEPPHEDVPVSCLLLMEASRLSILNHVCYRYRESRAGSATTSGSTDRHFNIFHAYETVLDEVRKRASNGDVAITEKVQNAFFNRAIWHYTTTLGTAGYIARGDRRKFFAMMNWHYLHYAPPGYRRPGGFRGFKFLLIEKDAYRLYSILEPVNEFRVKMGRITRTVRR